jgi:hypothetical protein
MAIIDDYTAIAQRMRELRAPSPKDAQEITDLGQWREAAFGTAKAYVQKRKMEIARGPLLRRRPQPTD